MADNIIEIPIHSPSISNYESHNVIFILKCKEYKLCSTTLFISYYEIQCHKPEFIPFSKKGIPEASHGGKNPLRR